MIISKKLLNQKKISHGFFNRNGGKSVGIFKSLNCGLGSKDKRNKVNANLKIVKYKIDKTSKNIFLLNQIHSKKFIYINKNSKIYRKKIKADAIITDQAKLPIAVLSADCVPILLYDKKKQMIAAIHAGWKGALKGIINSVIKFMYKKGCIQNNIIAAIGPCIGKESYNVKEDLKKNFLKKVKKIEFFLRIKKISFILTYLIMLNLS